MAGKIHIPNIEFNDFKPQALFTLCRPFLTSEAWGNDVDNFKTWNIEEDNIEYTVKLEEANIVLIPLPINHYFENKKSKVLKDINKLCAEYGIKGYGFVSGDLGKHYPEMSHLIYLRSGGFKSQLSIVNKGIPVFLGDHYSRIHRTSEVLLRNKEEKPTVGFCGHSTLSKKKKLKENLKMIVENGKRVVNGDFVLEPIFPSAYQRARLLSLLEINRNIKTNYIFRCAYRGGARTQGEREKTTFEYYHNIVDSDYVFCLRGVGNFSVRFYESLMCGRIPLFVNTDCILPQPDKIEWKKHVVWIEWKDRQYIAERLMDFHNEIHPDDFIKMQLKNRELWRQELSVSGTLKYLLT